MILRYPPELKTMPPPEWIFDGFLHKDSLALLYGPSHVGKSFLALEMLFCIAAQHDGIFRPNMPGFVLYVYGEGGAGIGLRINAWEQGSGYELPCNNPGFLGIPVQLGNAASLSAFFEVLRTRPPLVIVFDTLARCAVGLEENSAKEMGMLVDALEKIRREFSCAILLIHHSTKSNPKLERGSGVVFNAADTVMALRREEGDLVFECQKQKNGAIPPSRRLRLLQIGGCCVIASAGYPSASDAT